MTDKNEGTSPEQVEGARRDFLKKAAKLAVYAPPAMLVMSQPSYATFKKTGGQTYERPHRHRSHNRLRSWLRRLFK
jgi:hypothetical protein